MSRFLGWAVLLLVLTGCTLPRDTTPDPIQVGYNSGISTVATFTAPTQEANIWEVETSIAPVTLDNIAVEMTLLDARGAKIGVGTGLTTESSVGGVTIGKVKTPKVTSWTTNGKMVFEGPKPGQLTPGQYLFRVCATTSKLCQEQTFTI